MVSFTLKVPSILTPLSPSPPIPLLHLFSHHDKLALTLCSHNSNSHSQTTMKAFLSPLVLPAEKNRDLTRSVKLRSQLRYPIISPDDHWGTWAALFATGAFGLWSEKTKIGSMVSAALVSTLVGLAASNIDIIPYEARAYSIIMEFMLPLTVPLLLFRADLHRVIRSTGTLLLAFWLGLAVNYIAISEALGISPSVLAAGVAADNVATAVAISFLVCKTSTYLTNICGIQGVSLPAITAIVVILATVFPTQFGFLAPASETIALVLMQWEHMECH